MNILVVKQLKKKKKNCLINIYFKNEILNGKRKKKIMKRKTKYLTNNPYLVLFFLWYNH